MRSYRTASPPFSHTRARACTPARTHTPRGGAHAHTGAPARPTSHHLHAPRTSFAHTCLSRLECARTHIHASRDIPCDLRATNVSDCSVPSKTPQRRLPLLGLRFNRAAGTTRNRTCGRWGACFTSCVRCSTRSKARPVATNSQSASVCRESPNRSIAARLRTWGFARTFGKGLGSFIVDSTRRLPMRADELHDGRILARMRG